MARIAALIHQHAGLVFHASRHRTVEATVRAEASRAGSRDLEAYHDVLVRNPSGVDELAAQLTIGETYFCRDPGQLALLRDHVLPEIAARRSTGPIRLWSAGCASGEEAYTAAIICHELGLGPRATIVGSDLSRERLEAARAGRFGRWSLRGVPESTTRSYFTRRAARFDLAHVIRDMVEFTYVNLAELGQTDNECVPAHMDVILCRNVLIYFDADTSRRVTRQLVESLAPGGWLLLGASDPQVPEDLECEVVVTSAGLAYRRRGPAPSDFALRYAPAVLPDVSVPDASVATMLPSAACREVVETVPDDIAPEGEGLAEVVGRVRALADAGSLESAGAMCAAALERHPLSAELMYLQALLLVHAGRFAEAVQSARRAVYLDRSLAVAHLALGDSLGRMKRPGSVETARAFRSAHRLLACMDPDAIVPASGGERSGRLRAATAARLRLMEVG